MTKPSDETDWSGFGWLLAGLIAGLALGSILTLALTLEANAQACRAHFGDRAEWNGETCEIVTPEVRTPAPGAGAGGSP